MFILARHVVLVGVIFHSAQAFALSSWTDLYRIDAYPKQSDNCHLEARALGERFTSMTGAEAIGECESINEASFDILIYYKATPGVQPITTYPEMLLQDRVHMFKSEATCQDRLAIELSYFKATTGLDAFVSYCVLDETYYGAKSWAMRIDAFGSPQKRPFWAEHYMMGSVDEMTEDAAEEMIASTFRNTGLDVRLVHFRTDPRGSRQFSMLYYSDDPLDIQIKVLASSLETRAQCQSELAQVLAVVPEPRPRAIFCVNSPYVGGFEVSGVIDVARWFEAKLSAERFKTYADCAADRSRLIDLYRNTGGRDVAAGLCSKVAGVWRVNLLERPRS